MTKIEEPHNWEMVRGLIFILGGFLFSFLIIRVYVSFDKYYTFVPFFMLCLIFVSIPIASDISSRLVETTIYDVAMEDSLKYMWMIIIDCFIVAFIGLLIALKHISIKEKKSV